MLGVMFPPLPSGRGPDFRILAARLVRWTSVNIQTKSKNSTHVGLDPTKSMKQHLKIILLVSVLVMVIISLQIGRRTRMPIPVEDLVLVTNEVKIPVKDFVLASNEVKIPVKANFVLTSNEVKIPFEDLVLASNEVKIPVKDVVLTLNEVKIPAQAFVLASNDVKIPNITAIGDFDFGQHNCTDILCTEYLTNETGLREFTQCSKKQKVFLQTHRVDYMYVDDKIHASGKCRFMDPTNRGPVGLISTPGSGNTWVRELLQQATGICTGAVYCDGFLRASGFDGENVRSGAVIAIKDHNSFNLNCGSTVSKDRACYDSAILIVRNPCDSIVAEYNRRAGEKSSGSSPHTYRISSEDTFGSNHDWQVIVRGEGKRWLNMFDWLFDSTKPVLLVKFEDLKSDLLGQIRRMLDFLSYHYTDAELISRMNYTVSSQFRGGKPVQYEYYTPTQKLFMNDLIRQASEKLDQKLSNTFGIEEYTCH